MHRNRMTLSVAAVLLCTAGCRQPEMEVVALEDIVLPTITTVEKTGSESRGAPRNSYVTLVAKQTRGLFPCALAVARVRPMCEGNLDLNSELQMDMAPLNEVFDWLSLFDDTWPVSEVFPLTHPSRARRQITVLDIVEYAHDDGARLCLIYNVRQGETEQGSSAEIQGVLYDTKTGELLAGVHADQYVLGLTEDQLPPPHRSPVPIAL